jgi:hypothetical protein
VVFEGVGVSMREKFGEFDRVEGSDLNDVKFWLELRRILNSSID